MAEVTGLFVNTVACGWTPSGGSRTALTKITQSAIDKGASDVSFSGDGDKFPTFRCNVMNDPSVTLQGGRVTRYMNLISGAFGTLDFTWGDAKNGSGAGSVLWTLVNAMIGNAGASQPHANFASGSLEIKSYSSDGVTNPLSYSFN